MPQLGVGNSIVKRVNIINSNVFISTWKTDNTSTGSSTDHQVKLPLESGGTYNFVVDWGDGQKDTITAYNQAEVTHTYSSIGTYEIKIKGTIEGFVFNNSGDKLKLLSIDNGGILNVGNSAGKFYGCTNLTSINNLDTSNVVNMSEMFRGCSNLTLIGNLNTLNIENMDYMFYGCTNFNQAINFDTSNVENMSYMFYLCSNFNQNVNFNTSNVVNMNSMFYACSNFNKPINFNTHKVTIMYAMFYKCTNFNQPICLDTSKVTTTAFMFRECTNFNQSVSCFNTSKVTNMYAMFQDAFDFNQAISFNIEATTNIDYILESTNLSIANYDNLLLEWANEQNVKTGLTFRCTANYTSGGIAETARSYLVTTKSWTIFDNSGV